MSNILNKEKNFISAVVYLHNDGEQGVHFFDALNQRLDEHFEKYELIAVNDACTDDTIVQIKKWAKNITKPLTILNMSLYQSRENAMNAGLDASIGDYVLEFDSAAMPYDLKIVFDAYQTALKGNDIISVCPKKMTGSSKIFYNIFNKCSKSQYQIKTEAFRLVTRRAINRVHASSAYLPYRKAAYAASGLKMAAITFDGKMVDEQKGRISLAIDSLALYTAAGYRVSFGITLIMMAIALFETVYTLVVYLIGRPIEGWTTTMLVLTFGFSGLFFILSIIIKYITLMLEMIFKRQKYLIESIEKIQK